jgi:hypothetical protein
MAAAHGLVDRFPEIAAERARQGADVLSYPAELVVPGHASKATVHRPLRHPPADGIAPRSVG